MTQSTFKPSLALVLAHEGGFVNHPKDPGGPTNFGITQRVYDGFRKTKDQPTRSVRFIEAAEVAEIYRRDYWNAAKGDALPTGLDYAVFDYAVNSGVGRAIKDLQRTINAVGNQVGFAKQVVVDGQIGNATIAACNSIASIDEVAFIESYCNRRVGFLHSLKTFKTFGKGWIRRVLGDNDEEHANDGDNGVIDFAVKMASDDMTYPIPKTELPTPIGAKSGEVVGKAPESAKAVTKSADGIGAIAGGVGVSGGVIFQAADAIKPHMGDNGIGRLVAVVFGLLMLAGMGLMIYKFLERRKEQSPQ